MSSITNILIHCHTKDSHHIEDINRHLDETFGQVLDRLSGPIPDPHGHDVNRWGGSKVTSYSAWGAAFNYVSEGVLLARLAEAEWEYPDDVVVVFSGIDKHEERSSVMVMWEGLLRELRPHS